MSPPKKFDETYSVVRAEFNRQRNLELLNRLGFKKTPKTLNGLLPENSDKLIQCLLDNSLVDAGRIHQALE